MMCRTLIGMFLALQLSACSSDDASGSAGVSKFTADSVPAGAVVYLRQKSLDPKVLVVELMGRDLTDAYGVAWRLDYDPAVLRFEQLATTSVWSANQIRQGAEPRAGLLVAVVGAKGQANGPDAQDTPLAEIAFDRLSAGSSRIDFIAGRSAVVHSDGRHASGVQWVGGALGTR